MDNNDEMTARDWVLAVLGLLFLLSVICAGVFILIDIWYPPFPLQRGLFSCLTIFVFCIFLGWLVREEKK